MKLRSATPKDISLIRAIWTPVIETSVATFNSIVPSEADLVAMLTQKTGFFVAEDQDGLLGFAMYGQFRGGVGYRHTMEHTIILAPTAQGKGVGRALLFHLEADARSKGVHSLFAGVSAENDAGVLFHKACGYRQVAVLPEVGRKFDRWFDLVLLQKLL